MKKNVDSLEDILTIKTPRNKDIKYNFKSFEFTLFGRTFLFQTWLKKIKSEHIFEPVEPCQANEITAAVCQMSSEKKHSIVELNIEKIKRYQEEIINESNSNI